MSTEQPVANDVAFAVPSQTRIVNDVAGVRVTTVEGRSISMHAAQAAVVLSADVVAVEAAEIDFASEGAVQVTAETVAVASPTLEVSALNAQIRSASVDVETELHTIH
jgi:hypothetical protein